jgi:repressor LexA
VEVIRSTEIRALAIILSYTERGEQIPSQEQLAQELGLLAKSRVSTVLANLEKEGFIKRKETRTGKKQTRSVSLEKMHRARPVPVLGRVAAGQPLLANGDDLIEFVPLPARYVHGTEIYMLEVRGDSMIGDGILDGDYVIVDHNQKPRENEIAVVLIDDEATIKHIKYEGTSIRLVSSNPDSSNPEFRDQTYNESDRPSIQGKVIGLVRWPT